MTWRFPWQIILCFLCTTGLSLSALWLYVAWRGSSGPATFRSSPTWRRRYPLWFLSGLILTGTIYGYTSGRSHASQADHILGSPLVAVARVTFLSPSNPNIVGLTLERFDLQSDYQNDVPNGSGLLPCGIQAVWWHSTRAFSGAVSVGTRIQLQGILVDSTGKSVVQGLGQPTVYGFRGKLAGVVTGFSPFAALRSDVDHAVKDKNSKQTIQADLLESMVFGGTSTDKTTQQDFMSAGLLHVLVASGANIVILERMAETVLYPVWRRCRLPYSLWFLMLCFALWGYAGVCGFDASIVRATWMANYRIAGRFVGRTSSMRGGMAFCALAMALSAPGQLLTLSSLFSFIATSAIGMVGFSRPQHKMRTDVSMCKKLLHTMKIHVWIGLKITLCIEVLLTPVILWSFGQLTPYSVLSNVIAEPLLLLLLPVAALWIALTCIAEIIPNFSVICTCIQAIAFSGIQCLRTLVHWVSSLPNALVVVPKPPTFVILVFYGLVLATVIAWRQWKSASS